MSEWYDNQRQKGSSLSKLLRKQIEKKNSHRTLTAEEAKRLSKLKTISDKLKRGENVQNRQLQTWLSADEYAQIEVEWEE